MEKRCAAEQAAKEANAAKEQAAKKRPATFNASCKGDGERSCIFSQSIPGEPATGIIGGLCMFCDTDRFPLLAQTRNGKTNIKKALAYFQKHCSAAHDRAMQQVQTLPEEARSDIVDKNYWCCGQHDAPCVFSRGAPGKRARALPGELTCLWCGPALLRAAEEKPSCRRGLQQSLNVFRKKKKEVYTLAMSRLSAACKKALAASRARTQQHAKYRANAAKKRMSRR